MPEVADLNTLLAKNRMTTVKVTRVTEVELPKTEAVYEITVSGLG